MIATEKEKIIMGHVHSTTKMREGTTMVETGPTHMKGKIEEMLEDLKKERNTASSSDLA